MNVWSSLYRRPVREFAVSFFAMPSDWSSVSLVFFGGALAFSFNTSQRRNYLSSDPSVTIVGIGFRRPPLSKSLNRSKKRSALTVESSTLLVQMKKYAERQCDEIGAAQTPSTDHFPTLPCVVGWALSWREKLRSFGECGKKTVPPKRCPTLSVPRTWAGKGGGSDGSKRRKGDDRQHQVLLARRCFWGRILGQEGQAFTAGLAVDMEWIMTRLKQYFQEVVEKRAPQHNARSQKWQPS